MSAKEAFTVSIHFHFYWIEITFSPRTFVKRSTLSLFIVCESVYVGVCGCMYVNMCMDVHMCICV